MGRLPLRAFVKNATASTAPTCVRLRRDSGAGLGLAVTFSACGTHWSQETASCTNMTPMMVLVGPSYGALIGAAVGATFKTSSVVYTGR